MQQQAFAAQLQQQHAAQLDAGSARRAAVRRQASADDGRVVAVNAAQVAAHMSHSVDRPGFTSGMPALRGVTHAQMQLAMQQLQQQQHARRAVASHTASAMPVVGHSLGSEGGTGALRRSGDGGASGGGRLRDESSNGGNWRLGSNGRARSSRTRRVSSGGDLAGSDSLRDGVAGNTWDPFFLDMSEEIRTASDDMRAGAGESGSGLGDGAGGDSAGDADSAVPWAGALGGGGGGGGAMSGHHLGAGAHAGFGGALSEPGALDVHYLSAPVALGGAWGLGDTAKRLQSERIRDPAA
jgi:hypothetical protein